MNGYGRIDRELDYELRKTKDDICYQLKIYLDGGLVYAYNVIFRKFSIPPDLNDWIP